MTIPESVMNVLKEKVNNMRIYIAQLVPDRAHEISSIDFDANTLEKNMALFLLTGMNGTHIYQIIKRKFGIENDDSRLRDYCDCVYELLASCAR